MSFARAGAVAALLSVSLPLVGQGQQPSPDQMDSARILQKAIAKMQKITSVHFRARESADSAVMRQIAAQAPAGAMAGMLGGDKTVQGVWTERVLHASIGDGDQDILIHGRRCLARVAGKAWRLTRRKEFVFDPQLFFEALGQLSKQGRKIHRSKLENAEKGKRLVITLTLDGRNARQLNDAGVLPEIKSGLGGIARMAAMAMGGAGANPLKVDVALEIDPATAYVHKIRAAIY